MAAIMFTDMVGYTTLGQRNESLSLALLREQRKLIRPVLMRHKGREIKTIGDAFLVEFPNALDAVRCAYDIQRATREFNISIPEEKRIHLRVGLHLGDVVETQGDILGDAVNVASRIEQFAEDGGVCLTRQVYDHVSNKFELPLSSLGTKMVKNVSEPLEVFRMIMPWEKGTVERQESSPKLDAGRIAVLPFVSMSPDPNDEYFADGLTEEMIDRLSQMSELRVIARTSAMSYKKSNKRASEIGRELRVGALVEGSVRKTGSRIRVTVQLVNLPSEEHLWSSRYDKNLDDIFAVQSDIASSVCMALAGNLVVQPAPKTFEGTKNVAAYTHFLQGRRLLNEGTADSIKKALGLFSEATALDPSFARAYASLASCYLQMYYRGAISLEDTKTSARTAVQKGLDLNRNLAEAHATLAELAWIEDDYAVIEEEAAKAIELNPNLANAYEVLGISKAALGYPASSIRLLETAYVLDPLSVEIIRLLGYMYVYTGKVEKAREHWDRNLRIAPFDVLNGYFIGHILKKEYEKADETVKAVEGDFPEEFTTVVMRGYIEALKGNREGAERVIKTLRNRFQSSGVTGSYIGFIRYYLGDMDAFFEAMYRDAENHALNLIVLRYSSLLEKARQDPRYREVMLKAGLDPELKE